jgi:hypothetical protein
MRDTLVLEVQALLIKAIPPERFEHRTTSPALFGLPLHSRTRSSTDPQSSFSTNIAEFHRQLSTTYRAIEAKFALSWECAELLIELGGGPSADQLIPLSDSVSMERSASTVTPSKVLHSKPAGRERAITLSGDDSKPQTPIRDMPRLPVSSSQANWRASTGRHDLSHRQLLLLRDMLNSTESSAATTTDEPVAEAGANRNWRWGASMSNTVALPRDESSYRDFFPESTRPEPLKKRKSRLGMRGLRDMLKSIRNTYSQGQARPFLPPTLPIPAIPIKSTSAATTQSSLDLSDGRSQSMQYRQAQMTAGFALDESIRNIHPNNPYTNPSSFVDRLSPRRPSLASIFRIGQKSNRSGSSKATSRVGRDASVDNVNRTASRSSCQISSYTHTDEEWDKVESASELCIGLSSPIAPTMKGTNGRLPFYTSTEPSQMSRTHGKPPSNASSSSIWESTQSHSTHSPSSTSIAQLCSRSMKLSDVRELEEKNNEEAGQHRRSLSNAKRRASKASNPSPNRTMSRSSRKSVMTGSLRSPRPTISSPSDSYLPELENSEFQVSPLSLVMTPENIKPLLENAKEVNVRCREYLAELQQLVLNNPLPILH